jgi:uncharacterized protein involved in type VI secretion and phage assembly
MRGAIQPTNRSEGMVSKIHGLVTAKVKDRNSLGQVLLTYPWLTATNTDSGQSSSTGNNTGYWAPVATMMGGNSRGSWFMPEKDDDVLVAFDHGDFDHPYVVGFLWNGKSKPPSLDPDADADPQRRILRSVNGHMIEIYDPDVGSDGEKGYIRLRDAYGSEIVMQNSAITIHAVGSLRIDADDITIAGRWVDPGATSNI